MQMVRLNAEVHHSKRGSGRACDATANSCEHPRCAKRRQPSHHPQGNVNWVATVVDRSLSVRHAGPRSSWFASSARSASTPRPEPKGALSRLAHLDWVDNISNKQTCQVKCGDSGPRADTREDSGTFPASST